MKSLHEVRAYYECKECKTHGNIDKMLVAKCPTCGSRQLTFFKSEADYIKKEGRK